MFASGVGYPEIDYAGGLAGGYDDPEYVVPEVIVVWGKQPLASNGDGLFGHAVLDLMRRGAKLIAIDPRVNLLTTRAILQLRLRPGTDAALGLALIDVIVKEELYDKDFVEKWTWGFDELAARAAARTAHLCAAKPASIAWLAIDQQQNGALALTGNLDAGRTAAAVPGRHRREVEDGDGEQQKRPQQRHAPRVLSKLPPCPVLLARFACLRAARGASGSTSAWAPTCSSRLPSRRAATCPSARDGGREGLHQHDPLHALAGHVRCHEQGAHHRRVQGRLSDHLGAGQAPEPRHLERRHVHRPARLHRRRAPRPRTFAERATRCTTSAASRIASTRSSSS